MYKYIILLTIIMIFFNSMDTLHPFYKDCRYVKVTVYHNDPSRGLEKWSIVGLKGTEDYLIDTLVKNKYVYRNVGIRIAGICIQKVKPECEDETNEPVEGCEPDKETRVIYGR